METGNRYSAAVASIEDERIELIVREIFQAPENAKEVVLSGISERAPRRFPALRQGFPALGARGGRRGLR